MPQDLAQRSPGFLGRQFENRKASERPAEKNIAVPRRIILHPTPEFGQRVDPLMRLIADNQTGVDGSDRCADDPIRFDAGLMQRLIDTRLIGSKGAPALEDERDLGRLPSLHHPAVEIGCVWSGSV